MGLLIDSGCCGFTVVCCYVVVVGFCGLVVRSFVVLVLLRINLVFGWLFC